MAAPLVIGICIGGRARRMAGVQKALLIAPDTGETLVARLLRLGREAGHEVVLLGAAELGLDALQLPDAAPNVGPLAGLQSLLAFAGERDALCLACDMPFVSPELLGRLIHEQGAISSAHKEMADVVAPRDNATGKWEPLFARYRSATVAPLLERALAEGERSFQGLFTRLTVRELILDAEERTQLRDWDTPEDMQARP